MNRLSLILVLCLALGAGSAAAQGLPSFAQRDLTVDRAGGGPLTLHVEVAESPAQKAYGFMFRRELPRGQGMIFLFKPAQEAVFWMKNTLLPLDILFIAPDGRIVKIAAQARPMDPTPIPSDAPVAAVLEIGGGEAAAQGLATGDHVELW